MINYYDAWISFCMCTFGDHIVSEYCWGKWRDIKCAPLDHETWSFPLRLGFPCCCCQVMVGVLHSWCLWLHSCVVQGACDGCHVDRGKSLLCTVVCLVIRHHLSLLLNGFSITTPQPFEGSEANLQRIYQKCKDKLSTLLPQVEFVCEPDIRFGKRNIGFLFYLTTERSFELVCAFFPSLSL